MMFSSIWCTGCSSGSTEEEQPVYVATRELLGSADTYCTAVCEAAEPPWAPRVQWGVGTTYYVAHYWGG